MRTLQTPLCRLEPQVEAPEQAGQFEPEPDECVLAKSTPRKRVEMVLALASRPRVFVPGARRPRADDLPALARLMFDAYQGTVDYTGESVADAAAEIEKTQGGPYGPYLPQYSCVVERESALVSALLLTRSEGRAFLAFAMTAPGWKRMGIARSTLGNAIQDLYEAGETQLELVVNGRNAPALDLYLSLGFKAIDHHAQFPLN